MKDSFVLYSSYEENFKILKDKDRGKLIMAIFAFVRGEDKSSTLSKSTLMAYNFITQQIAIDIEKYNRICERNKQNASKGGRPRKSNQEKATGFDETQTEKPTGFNVDNLPEKSKATGFFGNNLQKPTGFFGNPYDNYSLVSSLSNNIFNNYSACVHAHVREKSIEERKPFKDFYKEVFDYCVTDKFLNPANEIIDTMIEAYNQSKTENGLKFKQVTYNANKLFDVFASIDSDKFRKIITQLVFNQNIENRAIYILGSLVTASQNPKCSNTPTQIEQLKQALNLDNSPSNLKEVQI